MKENEKTCEVCNGPLNLGEPFVFVGGKPAHYFRITCEGEKKMQNIEGHGLGVKVWEDDEY